VSEGPEVEAAVVGERELERLGTLRGQQSAHPEAEQDAARPGEPRRALAREHDVDDRGADQERNRLERAPAQEWG
jgi:hypothetical protein